MNTPEKCPKCGAGMYHGREYACLTVILDDGRVLEASPCMATQRDQLAVRVRELEAWKDSALAVEREWDPNQISALLGGKLGESQRAVIHWKVPKLVERLKRLEEAGRELARRHLMVVVTCPQALADVAEYEKAIE